MILVIKKRCCNRCKQGYKSESYGAFCSAACKQYAKDPERLAAIFGLNLLTLKGLSEEERKTVVLGFASETVFLDINDPIGISDLSDQNN